MSSVINDPNSPHHRRSREEVEALAKNFVATPVEDAPVAKPKALLIAGGAGALVVLALVAWVATSSGRSARTESAAAERAAAEVAELKARMEAVEAERERKRKELEAGQEYLQRIAAADAALMKDLTAQASRLADRVEVDDEPAPAPAKAPAKTEPVPTPREAPRTVATQPKPTTTTASAAPATTTVSAPPNTTSTAPQKAATAPQGTTTQQPAAAQPTTVAQADPSSCKIHVSELSSTRKLTYEDVKRVKGARIDEQGHVFLPPVDMSFGRSVVFEVMPDGCVRARRR